MSPEHPVHEFTHLWDRFIAEKKPELWKRGIELMKDPNQIKSATDNNGVFSAENDDIQMAIGWNTSIEDVFAKYPTLDYDLSKFNSQAMEYGRTKNGVGYVIYNGNYVIYSVDKDGMARPIKELSGTNETLKILENEFEESNNPRDFILRADKAWDNKQGGYKSNPSYIRNRRQYGRNDSHDRRQGGLRRENGLERGSKDSNITQEFITPQGEIYGFVDKDGNMYLDETIIDASHPIHEYTHLWDRALEKTNPQLWKRGIELMKDPNQIKSATDNNGMFSTENDDIQMAIDNKNNNSSLYNYEANRRTEENNSFPEILGNAGEEQKASRTLATAAYNTRRSQSNDGRQRGFQKEEFLAHLEVNAKQQGTWIDSIKGLGD